ncbi:unnamed protein product, partial [Amoebophrya sp. A120]
MVFFFLGSILFAFSGKHFTDVKFFTHTDFSVIVFVAFCYLTCYGALTLFFCSWIINWYALLGT